MATTTATGIFTDTSTTGSFMLPGMSSPEQASYSRVVRFNSECVLIPKTSPSTRSKLPVVLTKSYSLPLWKRKPHNFSDSDVEDAAGSSAQPQSPEDNRVTIKVPIPTFRRRSSRSPTPRGRSISSSPTITKSPPSCLVHRSPSASVKPSSPVHRPSLPIYHRRQDELTIPLRDCCADCERITEECLKEGDDWKEKFSRGARRRRSASLEYGDSIRTSSHTRNTGTFTPFSSASRDLTSRFDSTAAAAFTIVVDEVDKCMKYNMEDTDFIRTLSPPPSPSSPQLFHPSASPFASSSGSSQYPRMKLRDREVSSSSTVSSMSTTDELPPVPDTLDSRNRLCSSPIEEEDETQLFPLPRRSSSNTPSPSASPKTSPAPSPNGSTSSLPVRSSPYLSVTSLKQNSSFSHESILSNCLSRKVENSHLAATTASSSLAINATSALSSSSSSLSPQLKHMRGPIHGLNIPKAPASGRRAVSNPISSKGPPPSSFLLSPKVLSISEPSETENKPSSSSAIQIPCTISPSANTTTPNIISDQNTTTAAATATTTPLLIPPISNSPPSTDNNIPKNNTILPSIKPSKPEIPVTLPEPTNNNANTKSLPSSPIARSRPLQEKRKLSFTRPFIKAGGAIRDVGVDVLKGVSSMSSGGGGGGTSVVGTV